MRRLVARIAAGALVAAAVVVGVSGGPAGAEKPDASAYWVRTQNSSLPGQPPNPQVPPGDLSVVNDPSASATTPVAYSAVRLVAPDSVGVTLLLKLADVSTAPTIAVTIRDSRHNAQQACGATR